MWTLVAFFGASIAFTAVRNATKGDSRWLTVGVEVAVLAAIVGLIVVLVRRADRR